MVAKKAFVGLSFSALILAVVFFALTENVKTEKSTPIEKVEEIKKEQTVVQKPIEKKYDLYQNNLYDLPLFSIAEISKLSPIMKKAVDNLLENSMGVYFLRKVDDSVFAILINPINQGNTFHRHDLQFVEISSNGEVSYHNAGYVGEEGEIFFSQENDEYNFWKFSKTQEGYPVKHIAYDENKDVKYTEKWFYETDEKQKEFVKYEMKNAQNKVISLLKEISIDENHYRKEHIFYDNDGNILMSFSVNYEGASIDRMSFYNAHDSIDSVSVLTEYNDGLRVKEQIYNQDYELENVVEASYDNDVRTQVQVFSADGKEVLKISS